MISSTDGEFARRRDNERVARVSREGWQRAAWEESERQRDRAAARPRRGRGSALLQGLRRRRLP